MAVRALRPHCILGSDHRVLHFLAALLGFGVGLAARFDDDADEDEATETENNGSNDAERTAPDGGVAGPIGDHSHREADEQAP